MNTYTMKANYSKQEEVLGFNYPKVESVTIPVNEFTIIQEKCRKASGYMKEVIRLNDEVAKVRKNRDKYFDMAWDLKYEKEVAQKKLSEVSTKLGDTEIQLINSRNKVAKFKDRINLLEGIIKDMECEG